MQKYVNVVDLFKSFPISIYLQNSASIQPKTSLSRFLEEDSIHCAFASLALTRTIASNWAPLLLHEAHIAVLAVLSSADLPPDFGAETNSVKIEL